MNYINELIKNYPELLPIKRNIEHSYTILKNCFENKGKLLICGNGGSEADASHIQGELMKSFCKTRRIHPSLKKSLTKIDSVFSKKYSNKLELGLPTINISTFDSLNTAMLNDTEPSIIYANSVLNLGYDTDVLLAISTSGNSTNIINASIVAKAKGMKVIALTGKKGGKLKKYADECIIVPKNDTYRIQEFHLPIYHALCLELENFFY